MAKQAPRYSRKNLIILLLALVALYVIVPRLGSFRSSLETIRHAKVLWLGICTLALLASYLAAACTYALLAKKRLRYAPTVLVQVASMFTNRLLPAGAGAIGINYAYLRGQKHTPAAATAVVAANNLLGFVGHAILFLGFVLFGGDELGMAKLPSAKQLFLVFCAAAVLVVAGYAVVHIRQFKLRRFMSRTLASLRDYRSNPARLALAVISSMAMTSCYLLGLYGSVRALGLHLSVTAVFVVLTFGVAGATAVPTPGGLGAAEASIVGGLVLYGVSSADALAVALLYRLFTYWLAFAVGLIGFGAIRKLGYI